MRRLGTEVDKDGRVICNRVSGGGRGRVLAGILSAPPSPTLSLLSGGTSPTDSVVGTTSGMVTGVSLPPTLPAPWRVVVEAEVTLRSPEEDGVMTMVTRPSRGLRATRSATRVDLEHAALRDRQVPCSWRHYFLICAGNGKALERPIVAKRPGAR